MITNKENESVIDNRTYLLTNAGIGHQKALLDLLDESDEIWFGVAFFKSGGMAAIKEGLSKFLKDKTKRVNFYIGLGLGETDPKSLQSLYRLLNKSDGTLVLCDPSNGIFHTKVYVFRNGDRASIVTGSANLTHAGWSNNDEVSMCLEVSIMDVRFLEIRKYFDSLYQQYFTPDVKGLIDDYSRQLVAYQREARPPFLFRRKGRVTKGIDMSQIIALYLKYQESNKFIDVKSREHQYRLALGNLNILASQKVLGVDSFHDLFGPLVGHKGYDHLWHSGSTHRKSHVTLNYIDGFRDLVRLAIEIGDGEAHEVYERMSYELLAMKRAGKIKGIGENILAEILMTLNPIKFANLNNNPVAVLSYFGCDFPAPGSFTGEEYKAYLRVLDYVMKKLKMNSFLEIDSFFNYVYWPLSQGLL